MAGLIEFAVQNKDFMKKAIRNVAGGIDFIRKKEVAVGIFEATDGAHEGGMKNSELLYLHCNGSPANNIPPRNVLKAGLEDEGTKKQMKKLIHSGMRKALFGNLDGAEAEYEKAGMLGAQSVQAQFGVIPPPNAPSTVARKGSSATLIDTGALRQAISYVVRDKG